METVNIKKIDDDSYSLPRSNFGNVRDLSPGYPEETVDIILLNPKVSNSGIHGL